MSFFSLIYSTGLKERSRFGSLVKVETEESGKNTFYLVIPAKESASFPVSLRKSLDTNIRHSQKSLSAVPGRACQIFRREAFNGLCDFLVLFSLDLAILLQRRVFCGQPIPLF